MQLIPDLIPDLDRICAEDELHGLQHGSCEVAHHGLEELEREVQRVGHPFSQCQTLQ